MRDPADTFTAEIPGETPPPPLEPRSTAAVRRLAVVYQDPRTRQGCRNCRHSVVYLRPGGPRHGEQKGATCTRHNFPVNLGGICADHEE